MRTQTLSAPASIGDRPLRLVERADPAPAADGIAIDVAACAVCRTDLQIVEGDLPPRRLPFVPGHQVVGRIRAVGEGVDRWTVGDRVGVGWLAGACGSCAACRADRADRAHPIPAGL